MRPIIAAFAVALMTSTAFAQVQCGSRKMVEKNLQEKYGEALIAVGKAGGGGEGEVQSWLEIWASPKRTFTLIFREEGKEVSCIIGVGDELTFRAPKASGDGI